VFVSKPISFPMFAAALNSSKLISKSLTHKTFLYKGRLNKRRPL
jgi:hypothetical protein